MKLHIAAVSDHDESVQFELSPEAPGDSRVRLTDASQQPALWGEQTRRLIDIPAVRLDSLTASGEIDLSLPTLLWMDVQGHEAHVLDGAQSFHDVPTVVEYWPCGLSRAGSYDRFIEIVEKLRGGRRDQA